MEETRFSFQDLDEEVNIPDLQKWIDERVLVGLIDEEKGGIVGYFNIEHEEEFFKLLNKIK